MSDQPITTPGRVISAAFYAALSPLVEPYGGIPACYWQRAPGAGPAAALINGELAGAITVQAQGNLVSAGWIGEATVEGSILVKAFAADDDAAQELMADAAAAIAAGLSTPAGYRATAAWAAEVVLPPTDGIYTAAALYRVAVRRD